ncbi:putative AN1-type zinc finger protein 1 [Apostichopus japonicus]|uniref:Putative AN1-type zinc finger protein 1 n=1 Tax=Stichopus japonicus TaxID=307972 RepID=A0A2G8KGC6_STIJA|nr:putative AN1-type zinc finger protein 1 [Apostichopus japonicus]
MRGRDFLPFTCSSCNGIFCLEHRSTAAHNCEKAEEKVASSTVKSEFKSYSCSKADCRKKGPVPVTCPFCNFQFCMSHRHPQDHDCTKMPEREKSVPMAETAKMVKEIQARHRTNPRRQTPKSEKARQTAAKVALMKMKMHAKGDAGIPQIDVSILITKQGEQNSLTNCLSENLCSIGRIVDWLANTLKLENENDKEGTQKLKLFHSDTFQAFTMDTKLRDLMNMEKDQLYSGSEVILDYVPEGSDDIQDINN